MLSVLLAFALSAPISGVCAAETADVVAAYEEAIGAANEALAQRGAEVAALKQQAEFERARSEAIERHHLAVVASYERELAAVRRELGASRWRRILDSLVAGGVGFSVGVVLED